VEPASADFFIFRNRAFRITIRLWLRRTLLRFVLYATIV
jgi:hypothetical protein